MKKETYKTLLILVGLAAVVTFCIKECDYTDEKIRVINEATINLWKNNR